MFVNRIANHFHKVSSLCRSQDQSPVFNGFHTHFWEFHPLDRSLASSCHLLLCCCPERHLLWGLACKRWHSYYWRGCCSLGNSLCCQQLWRQAFCHHPGDLPPTFCTSCPAGKFVAVVIYSSQNACKMSNCIASNCSRGICMLEGVNDKWAASWACSYPALSTFMDYTQQANVPTYDWLSLAWQCWSVFAQLPWAGPWQQLKVICQPKQMKCLQCEAYIWIR